MDSRDGDGFPHVFVVRKHGLYLSAPRYAGDTVAWITLSESPEIRRTWMFATYDGARKARNMHDTAAEVVEIPL